jgi:hypothetical protein
MDRQSRLRTNAEIGCKRLDLIFNSNVSGGVPEAHVHPPYGPVQ